VGDDVSDLIEQMKRLLGAKNEAELARRLGVNQSVISSWKSRGSVPMAYRYVLGRGSTLALGTPPMNWAPYENAALALAVRRWVRVADSDGGHRLPVIDDLWTLFRAAVRSVLQEMEAHQVTAWEAAERINACDAQLGRNATERDAAEIAAHRPRVEFE
jgi:hypothetical protein